MRYHSTFIIIYPHNTQTNAFFIYYVSFFNTYYISLNICTLISSNYSLCSESNNTINRPFQNPEQL